LGIGRDFYATGRAGCEVKIYSFSRSDLAGLVNSALLRRWVHLQGVAAVGKGSGHGLRACWTSFAGRLSGKRCAFLRDSGQRAYLVLHDLF
jgi:hypothetical protein